MADYTSLYIGTTIDALLGVVDASDKDSGKIVDDGARNNIAALQTLANNHALRHSFSGADPLKPTAINAIQQFVSMPQSVVNGVPVNGQIAQYVGATNANYTKGYYYVCTVSGTSCSWVNLSVQKDTGIYISGLSLPTVGYSDLQIAITANGVLYSGNHVYDMIPAWSETLSIRHLQQQAWGLINNYVVSADNQITISVNKVPQTAVPFVLKEVM